MRALLVLGGFALFVFVVYLSFLVAAKTATWINRRKLKKLDKQIKELNDQLQETTGMLKTSRDLNIPLAITSYEDLLFDTDSRIKELIRRRREMSQ